MLEFLCGSLVGDGKELPGSPFPAAFMRETSRIPSDPKFTRYLDRKGKKIKAEEK